MILTREGFTEFISDLKEWEKHLDDTQSQVIKLWLRGNNYPTIAEVTNITKNKVRTIIHGTNRYNKGSIYRKLQAVKRMQSLGLIIT